MNSIYYFHWDDKMQYIIFIISVIPLGALTRPVAQVIKVQVRQSIDVEHKSGSSQIYLAR